MHEEKRKEGEDQEEEIKKGNKEEKNKKKRKKRNRRTKRRGRRGETEEKKGREKKGEIEGSKDEVSKLMFYAQSRDEEKEEDGPCGRRRLTISG